MPSPAGVYHGHYDIGGLPDSYDDFLRKSNGVAPAITFTFHDWNAAGIEAATPRLQSLAAPLEGGGISPLELAQRVADDGAVLALAWDAIGYLAEHPAYFTIDDPNDAAAPEAPVRWDDVFAGRYDDYLRTVAAEVKRFGRPLMLSPAAEFNSIGYFSFGPRGNRPLYEFAPGDEASQHYGDPDTPDGPERVRDLYRYVIDFFRGEGVRNVTWFMYSHTAYMNPDAFDDGPAELLDLVHPWHYYPGDDYVDWIGGSVYVDADDPQSTYAGQIEDALAAWRGVTDKPFFIPELGIVSRSGRDRSEAVGRLFGESIPGTPEVTALAMADSELFARFFDVPRLGAGGDGELDAWRAAVIDSPEYAGRVVTRVVPEPSAAAGFMVGAIAATAAGRRRRA